ncbi:hypothetical protein FQN54_006831 [Arachnomyces sp. PD_36]|nr:hypothetical protein FQN54_006831 [Arachnomyces sp. PD_36]
MPPSFRLPPARPPSPSAKTTRTPASPPPSEPTPEPKPNTTTFSFRSRFRSRFTLPPTFKRTFRVLGILLPIIPIGLVFSEHVAQVMWVRGPSMTPYLNEEYATSNLKSDMVLVNMWRPGRELKRGMVVTFRSPSNPAHTAIKRIIALPGDRVTTRSPCLKDTQIIPWNHVWVEGDADDPKKSLDSNTYGPVSMSLISGRVVGVLWPRPRELKWWDWDEERGAGVGGKQREGVRGRVEERVVDVSEPSLD